MGAIRNIFGSFFTHSFLSRKGEGDCEDNEEPEKIDVEDLMVDVNDCVRPDFRICLDVMTIADCHGKLMQKEIQEVLGANPTPNVVFFLGDNFPSDIEAALEVIPKSVKWIFGVTGNHDAKDALERYSDRILDVNKGSYSTGGMVSSDDYSVCGLSGSIRYKDDDYYSMLSNEESESIMANKPWCDILITHDKPCFSVPETLTSHSGLTGIGKYILQKKPQLVLHGHIHERYIKRLGETIIRSCYGVEMFKATLSFPAHVAGYSVSEGTHIYEY